MSTLYNLTKEFLDLLNMAEEASEEDAQLFQDTLDGLDFEIEVKAEGCAMVMRELSAKADGIQKEIDRLTNMKKSIINNRDRIQKSLESSMIATGKKKFKTDLFSFGIQKNPPKLVIDKPEDVPQEFLIAQDPKIDNTAIKKLLKDKELGYAHLEQTESLRIR